MDCTSPLIYFWLSNHFSREVGMLTELFLKNFLFALDKFVNLNYKIIGS